MTNSKSAGYAFTLSVCSALFLSDISMADEPIQAHWEIKDCMVIAKSADMTLSTDGILSDQKIHFNLDSDVPLKNAPMLELNTAAYTSFNLEGVGRGFGFEFDYTPMHVSYLLHENATLVISYEPIYEEYEGGYYTYHAAFKTTDLPAKIAEMAEVCHK